MTSEAVLRVEHLSVEYLTRNRVVHALRDVSLEIAPRTALGVVGESGSGKSTLAFAVMRYLPGVARVTNGRILFEGRDLASLSERDLQNVRGGRIAMVYQDPMSSLNPSLQVGDQVAEAVRAHEMVSAREAEARVIELFGQVNLPDPRGISRRYPHQLSGGQQQRVVIAMALACRPDLLIMDEPTTGLDVTTEAQILDLVQELRATIDTSVLFITHNLGVVARVCDQIAVMYAGTVVERGTTNAVFEEPAHPYTAGLLAAMPRIDRQRVGRLQMIPGSIADLPVTPCGCIYAPRCPQARERCREEAPSATSLPDGRTVACHFWMETASLAALQSAEDAGEPAPREAPAVLTVESLEKRFPNPNAWTLPFIGTQQEVRAVNGVSLEIEQGETLAVVGESGCGKSTVARCVVGLLEPSAGRISLLGKVLGRRRSRQDRQALQIVFQNPDSTLNPAQRVGEAIGRPLELFAGLRGQEKARRVSELLKAVRLGPEYADRYPDQLSGGERQRVGIARAFAAGARVVVCDEPVSALDVSVQASVLNLLQELQRERQTAYLFISHDLAVVRHLAQRVLILYLGQVVESGTTEQVFAPPYHPYTAALLSAVPVPDPALMTQRSRERIRLEGPVPSPSAIPSGCPFHTRCPQKLGRICEELVPPAREAAPGHVIRCHIPI